MDTSVYTNIYFYYFDGNIGYMAVTRKRPTTTELTGVTSAICILVSENHKSWNAPRRKGFRDQPSWCRSDFW